MLPQPDVGLFFNASKRADRDVADRMWDSDSSFFRAVLKLFVTPFVRNFIPAVFPQSLDDFTAAHDT